MVASEVKALAEQTAKATGEIGQQINGTQAATHDWVNAIRQISGTIERLSEVSSAIAAAVEEQGAATQEIPLQRAAQASRPNIADVQRGASQTGSASCQVLSAARTLSGDSGRLRDEASTPCAQPERAGGGRSDPRALPCRAPARRSSSAVSRRVSET